VIAPLASTDKSLFPGMKHARIQAIIIITQTTAKPALAFSG
jgi:hypothetical protein